MKHSKRFETLSKRPINQDSFIKERPEKGFVAMKSPNDPEPTVKVKNGKIVELDGKSRENFDFIDSFIADYAINTKISEEAIRIDSLKLARMLVDINIDRKTIINYFSGLTPAKIIQVLNELNVVEMMMAMQKIRARKTPAN
jgi:glycerol dehydratase large subunit